MFEKIGALWVDHLAVTTDCFEETARDYLALPNTRILRGPGWNASQRVRFLFITFGSDLCIEILGRPKDGDSPIAAHVNGGGGAYHLCYAVNDLDHALEQAENCGARIIVAPKSDDAYNGRRIAFLGHPAHGLFELLEAHGSVISDSGDNRGSFSSNKNEPYKVDQKQKFSVEISKSVEAAFRKIFDQDLPLDPYNWTPETVKGWDSLAQMRLVMEIERTLDVSIPSSDLSNLQSFSSFLSQMSK